MSHALKGVSVVLLAPLLLLSCSRSGQQTDEVKAMREEVASLRVALAREREVSSTEATNGAVANSINVPPRDDKDFEESKNRISNFLEKAGKLDVMAQQGVGLSEFKSQLSDVRASWESFSVVGLPKELVEAEPLLTCAIGAWTQAEALWSAQTKAAAVARGPGNPAVIVFTVRAGPRFADKLDEIGVQLRAASLTPPKSPYCGENPAEKSFLEDEVRREFHYVFMAAAESMLNAAGPAVASATSEIFKVDAMSINRAINETCGTNAGAFRESIRFNDAARLFGGDIAATSAPVSKDAGMSAKMVRPSAAIKWCFSSAAIAFGAAKDKISMRMKERQQRG